MTNTFTQKAVLPKEVAQAIEFFKNGHGDEKVLTDMSKLEQYATATFTIGNPNSKALYDFIKSSVENEAKYFRALTVGYEVEKTEEEKAIEEAKAYYRSAATDYRQARIGSITEAFAHGQMSAIRKLERLGVLTEPIAEDQ